MKNLIGSSVLRGRINRLGNTLIFILIFFLTQNINPTFAHREKCKVGDHSVAQYNNLSRSEQKERVENYRLRYKPAMDMTVNAIKGIFQNKPIKVKNRLKTVNSIQEKIIRRGHRCFSELTDIAGVRIIIPDYAAIPIVTNTVENEFVVQEKDYFINDQRGTGYRAIHYLIVVAGHIVELQVHTVRGTIWAGIHHKLVYKGPYDVNGKVDNYLKQLSRALYLLDSGLGAQLPPIPTDLPAMAKTELQKGIDSIKNYNQDVTLSSTHIEEESKIFQQEALLNELQPAF